MSVSDAEKQRQAETLGHLAMLAKAAERDLKARGDQTGLTRLREDVRRSAIKTIGVDVEGLRLTANGLGR